MEILGIPIGRENRGELHKINIYSCSNPNCDNVYLPPQAASLISLASGWYTYKTARDQAEHLLGADAILRSRGGNGNQRSCPECNILK